MPRLSRLESLAGELRQSIVSLLVPPTLPENVSCFPPDPNTITLAEYHGNAMALAESSLILANDVYYLVTKSHGLAEAHEESRQDEVNAIQVMAYSGWGSLSYRLELRDAITKAFMALQTAEQMEAQLRALLWAIMAVQQRHRERTMFLNHLVRTHGMHGT